MNDQLLETAIAQIERLAAIEDIKQLKARYFRFVDQQDWESFRTLFVPESRFELGAGTFEGVDSMLEHVRDMLSGGSTVHHGHMPEIDVIDSDHARGTWALFDRVVPPPNAGQLPFNGYARYWEEYRRVDGAWLISQLRIERFHRIPLSDADRVG